MKKASGLVAVALVSILCCSCSSGGTNAVPAGATACAQPAETEIAATLCASQPAAASPEPAATAMPEPVKADMPEGLTVLGECELKNTNVSTDSRHNIMCACQMLDGLRLLPGQELSLNAATRHPKATGYYVTHVYPDTPATYRPPGMTRVAGALYNAALLADLTIVERHAFASPAAYLPAGLEAAFNNDAGGGLALADLVIRNGKDASVWIRAEFLAKNLGDGFRVRILGSPWEGERPVSLKSTILEKIAPPEETAVRTSRHAQPGEPYEYKARAGARVRVERVWQDTAGGGTRAEFLYEAYYPPFPRTLVYYPGEEPGG